MRGGGETMKNLRDEALTALCRELALLCPSILFLLMLLVIGVLLIRVLPVFEEVYASLGGGMTGLAGGLLRLGEWLAAALPWLTPILAVLAAPQCTPAAGERCHRAESMAAVCQWAEGDLQAAERFSGQSDGAVWRLELDAAGDGTEEGLLGRAQLRAESQKDGLMGEFPLAWQREAL